MPSTKDSDIQQTISDISKMQDDLQSTCKNIIKDLNNKNIVHKNKAEINKNTTRRQDKVKGGTGFNRSAVKARWAAVCESILKAVTGKRGEKHNNIGGKTNKGETPAADDADEIKTESQSISEVVTQIKMLCSTLDQMKFSLEELKDFEEEIGKTIQSHLSSIQDILEHMNDGKIQITDSYFSGSSSKIVIERIHEMNIHITKLKSQIPSFFNASSSSSTTATGTGIRRLGSNIRTRNSRIDSSDLLSLSLNLSGSFEDSPIFQEIEGIFKKSTDSKKKCLLSFVVFPENEVVKSKVLSCWWWIEGLLQNNRSESTIDIEAASGEILREFVEKGLIEPCYKKRDKRVAKRFRMTTLVRSSLLKLAGDETCFLGYNKFNWNNTRFRNCKKACLLKSEVDLEGKDLEDYVKELRNIEWGKLCTLFNVDETIPDQRLKSFAKQLANVNVIEWLGRMKSLKVFHLGRWQTSVKHHIQVGSTDFLKALKNMPNLRLLSLEGVSNISKIPESSITALGALEILNLKACYNLEELPKGISSLNKLKQLDLSGCFLIEDMPKGLSSLTSLQILKGFVVRDVIGRSEEIRFCTLEDLVGMKSLSKLSITIARKEFPTDKDLGALGKLQNLKKLTISWGAIMSKLTTDQSSAKQKKVKSIKKMPMERLEPKSPDNLSQPKLPDKLEKLDIHGFPEMGFPNWVTPDDLPSLRKLYIRGGRLGDLHGRWESVETLRLKYLSGLKMDCEQLRELFPKMEYLEKVDCPMITFCPSDENGVWLP